MKLADLVGNLSPEEKFEKNTFVPDKNSLQKIIDIYDKSIQLSFTNDDARVQHVTRELSTVEDLPHEYLQLISERIPEPRDHRISDFLGAVCKKLIGNPTLILHELRWRFGDKLDIGDRIVTVIGNVSVLGSCMQSGTIHLKGYVNSAGTGMYGGKLLVEDTSFQTGPGMRGGHIYVKGDSHHVAWEATGGTITCYGEATGHLGYKSHSGCTIHLQGNQIPLIDNECKATIYHRGRKLQ